MSYTSDQMRETAKELASLVLEGERDQVATMLRQGAEAIDALEQIAAELKTGGMVDGAFLVGAIQALKAIARQGTDAIEQVTAYEQVFRERAEEARMLSVRLSNATMTPEKLMRLLDDRTA